MIVERIITNEILPNSTTRALRISRANSDYKIVPGAGAILSIDGIARPYSFACGDKNDFYYFLIRVVDGEFNNALAKLNPGDTIVIEEFFRYFDLTAHPKSYYFATGTGIAPFIAAMEDYDLSGIKKIFYGAKQPSDLITPWMVRKKSELLLYVSGYQVGENNILKKGYISEAVTPDIIHKDAKYFVCGLADMVQDVTSKLTALGVTHDQICVELFYSKN